MRGCGSGSKVEILGECSTPKSAPDFCWRGSLRLSCSARPPMKGTEKKLCGSGCGGVRSQIWRWVGGGGGF